VFPEIEIADRPQTRSRGGGGGDVGNARLREQCRGEAVNGGERS
jgi:hypothetical protein